MATDMIEEIHQAHVDERASCEAAIENVRGLVRDLRASIPPDDIKEEPTDPQLRKV
jgi:glutamate mutase epsilon subunit